MLVGDRVDGVRQPRDGVSAGEALVAAAAIVWCRISCLMHRTAGSFGGTLFFRIGAHRPVGLREVSASSGGTRGTYAAALTSVITFSKFGLMMHREAGRH